VRKRPGLPLLRWKFPKSEAKASDISNLAFLAPISAISMRPSTTRSTSPFSLLPPFEEEEEEEEKGAGKCAVPACLDG